MKLLARTKSVLMSLLYSAKKSVYHIAKAKKERVSYNSFPKSRVTALPSTPCTSSSLGVSVSTCRRLPPLANCCSAFTINSINTIETQRFLQKNVKLFLFIQTQTQFQYKNVYWLNSWNTENLNFLTVVIIRPLGLSLFATYLLSPDKVTTFCLMGTSHAESSGICNNLRHCINVLFRYIRKLMCVQIFSTLY